VQQAAYVQFSLGSYVDYSVSHSGYSEHHGKTSDVAGLKGCASHQGLWGRCVLGGFQQMARTTRYALNSPSVL